MKKPKEANALKQGEWMVKPEEWLRASIVAYTETSENTLMNSEKDPAWGRPLVGFASGDDPLWDELKRHIGTFFLTPAEIFAEAFPGLGAGPEELTVISWVLPQTERTKEDHRKEKAMPSERWARARKYGEEFNVKLRKHVVDILAAAGYEAVAPQLTPFWKTDVSEKYGFASTWSERHAAYASGLGTFGLCDGLITAAGKAMRSGSVIARLKIPASPRPYQDHHAYCLFFAKGVCGKCIERCPAGAITKEGHNKQKCRDYLEGPTNDYIRDRFGFEAYGCGFCQVGVPCESRIPVKQKGRDA
jgi:epoxyqueuosine reductase